MILSQIGSLGRQPSGCRHRASSADFSIPQLARDFSEFLKLLNSARVEYLLVGGYAVGIHGYVRATSDPDIWIRISPENARVTERTQREVGFADGFE